MSDGPRTIDVVYLSSRSPLHPIDMPFSGPIMRSRALFRSTKGPTQSQKLNGEREATPCTAASPVYGTRRHMRNARRNFLTRRRVESSTVERVKQLTIT